MTETPTFEELQARYGKPERVDSAMNMVLVHLDLSAEVTHGCVTMTHRYQSVEAFNAYKAANLVTLSVVANPDNWDVIYYGPVFIGPGVYGLTLIMPKGRFNDHSSYMRS